MPGLTPDTGPEPASARPGVRPDATARQRTGPETRDFAQNRDLSCPSHPRARRGPVMLLRGTSAPRATRSGSLPRQRNRPPGFVRGPKAQGASHPLRQTRNIPPPCHNPPATQEILHHTQTRRSDTARLTPEAR